MAFEEMNPNEEMGVEEATPPEESSNRPFFIIAGVLGALTLIAVACIAAYAFYYVPQSRNARATQVAKINVANTEVAAAAAQTIIAAAATATPTNTLEAAQATATTNATVTPVIVLPTQTIAVATATQDSRTATVAALLTQAASAGQVQKTLAPGITPTVLPSTGFADEVGIPGLIGLAILMLVVIILSRRLRLAR